MKKQQQDNLKTACGYLFIRRGQQQPKHKQKTREKN